MDKKRIVKFTLSILCVFALVCPIYATDVQDNQYFGYKTEKTDQRQKKTEITSSDEFVCENDELKMYLNKENLGIKVENKKTGYVWGSVLEQEDESLNKTWSGMAQSGVSIDYMDEKSKTRTASITNSRVQMKTQTNEKGFTTKINFKQVGFEMELTVELDKQELVFKVSHKTMKETSKDNKVQSLYLYPFLGFTKNQETDGYMFVPDGSGALIRLDEKNTAATSLYQGRVYGEDYAVTGTTDSVEALSSVSQVSMPVYGFVHGVKHDGFLAHIEQGEEYSIVQATPAGITTPYNWMTSKFVLRDSYFQYINKQKKGFVTVPEEKNEFDIQVRYHFLSNQDATYIGMANVYQQRLIKQGVLKKNNQDKIGMQLEVLMSEKKKGLFFDSTVEMTTTKQLEEILFDIEKTNVTISQVNLRGYGKSGANRQVESHTRFENAVLTKQDLKQLQEKFPKVDISLYTDYMRKYKGWFGYGDSSHNALSLNEQLLQFRNHDDIYVSPNQVVKDYQDEQDDLGVQNIAMANVGKLLYSNYNSHSPMNRSEVKEAYTQMLKGSKNKVGLYGHNAYLWQYTDTFLDMDLSSSHYFLFDEDVPFMQMVLKGYKDYYAMPLNMTSTSQELLKMIEYGALPAYLLTYEDSKKLMKTESDWIYSSQYDALKERMKKQYNFLYDGLNTQMNSTIIDREVLSSQVVKVTYSNNKQIIINYSSDTYIYLGQPIAEESYKVIDHG